MFDIIRNNLFLIIFILILIYILLLTGLGLPKTLQDTLWTHCRNSVTDRIWGSYYPRNALNGGLVYGGENKGGFMNNRPFNLKKVRIIDIANLAGKEMIDNKSFPKLGQYDRMLFYIDIIERYHRTQNISPREVLIYVIKNYKHLRGSCTIAPVISKRIWKRLRKLAENPQLRIAVAEDYEHYPKATWKNPNNHYLRARDDYLCFYIAQNYKKKYTKAIVVSNDKFKDFGDFNKIPPFMSTYIWGGKKINILKEKINTQRGRLGQYRDYTTEAFNVHLY